MQVNITGRHLRLSDETREYIQERAEKLKRYFDGITSIKITADRDQKYDQVKVEFIVHTVRGVVFAVAGLDTDLHVAADRASEKAERKLVGLKEKMKERRNKRQTPAEMEEEGVDEEDETYEEIIQKLLLEPEWELGHSYEDLGRIVVERNMELSDFLVEDALIDEMVSTDKKGAVRELVEALAKARAIKKKDVDSVVDALMKREELGSTGIGKGVAVPHARHPSIKKLVGVFGHSSKGVEFASLDGEPVHAIFLLVSPISSSGQHLEALALISRMLRNNTFCRLLRETTGKEPLVELLRDAKDFHN